MTKPVILVVDDEKNTREGLARALAGAYRILLAANGVEAMERLAAEGVDLVLSDVRMPDMDGMTLIRQVLARPDPPICVLLTAYGSIETAVEAMKSGAYDFLTKPVNLDELELLISRALRSRNLEVENRALHAELDKKYGLESIVGEAPPMQEVFDIIRQVAPTRATVLITGESGTGKELVAHALHRLSPRAKGPFVAVHCAALAETLLESELFGHEKGAFTGAVEQRRGRFELADGGTLFLDEVGEIAPAVQVKLLRALEERQFERVGGQKTIPTDVRLVAATNRDLQARIREGAFREDLYYRLHVVAIRMPPLRERGADIPLLARHFLREFSRENGREIEGFTPEVMTRLQTYPWPGNVRELRNTVENMVVMSRGARITARDLPPPLRDTADSGVTLRNLGGMTLRDGEQKLIEAALRAHQGNRTRAAAQLGISRKTLQRKLAEYREPPAAG